MSCRTRLMAALCLVVSSTAAFADNVRGAWSAPFAWPLISAHAVLTPFWAKKLGRDSFTAHQASQRGGDLTLRLDGEKAWLGGPCVTVVKGAFYL